MLEEAFAKDASRAHFMDRVYDQLTVSDGATLIIY